MPVSQTCLSRRNICALPHEVKLPILKLEVEVFDGNVLPWLRGNLTHGHPLQGRLRARGHNSWLTLRHRLSPVLLLHHQLLPHLLLQRQETEQAVRKAHNTHRVGQVSCLSAAFVRRYQEQTEHTEWDNYLVCRLEEEIKNKQNTLSGTCLLYTSDAADES